MENKNQKPLSLVDSGILAIILTAVVTGLSLFLSALLGVTGWKEILSASLITIIIFLGLAFIVVRYFSIQIFSRIDGLIERFTATQEMKNSSWLITSSELKEIERTTVASSIWVITRSLEEELDADLFGDVIKQNLKKNKTYTYFIPNNHALRARVTKMRDIYNSPNLKFKMIQSELFDIISAQDVAIYGAEGKGAKEMAGYMNLPIENGGNEYFVVMGPRQAERIVGILNNAESTVL